MKFSNASSGVGTMGLAGVSLMVLHITDHITGWYWPFLYIFLLISAIGQENRK